jgi:microsomal dipeptidase-like Zn-dependent dipeptidase
MGIGRESVVGEVKAVGVPVVDVHVHTASYLPRYAARGFRFIYRRTMPADVPLSEVRSGGVDAIVAKAVGDPLATNWWGRSSWRAVDVQLRNIETETQAMGGQLVSTVAEIEKASAAGQLAVMLGVEGGNAIGHDLSRLDRLWARGVRLIVLVHLGHNQLGTTCLPWQKYIGGVRIGRPRTPGLTAFGGQVVDRMNQLGMIIDTSHSDSTTLLDILERSSQPVVASHTGARALDDFERYLTDDEIRRIGDRGGLIGLWPYRGHERGVKDVKDLIRHAQHMAAITGPEQLCLGTDMNGVPGVMSGYRGEQDVPVITEGLLDGGFSPAEVRGILGGNFLRLFGQISQIGQA